MQSPYDTRARTCVFAAVRTFLTDAAGGIDIADTNNVISDGNLLVDAYD